MPIRYLHFIEEKCIYLILNIIGHDVIHDYGNPDNNRWESVQQILINFYQNKPKPETVGGVRPVNAPPSKNFKIGFNLLDKSNMLDNKKKKEEKQREEKQKKLIKKLNNEIRIGQNLNESIESKESIESRYNHVNLTLSKFIDFLNNEIILYFFLINYTTTPLTLNDLILFVKYLPILCNYDPRLNSNIDDYFTGILNDNSDSLYLYYIYSDIIELFYYYITSDINIESPFKYFFLHIVPPPDNAFNFLISITDRKEQIKSLIDLFNNYVIVKKSEIEMIIFSYLIPFQPTILSNQNDQNMSNDQEDMSDDEENMSDGQRNEQDMSDGQRHYEDMSDGQRHYEDMSDGQRHYEDMSDHDKDMSDGQRHDKDMSDGQRNEEYMSDDYQRHDKDMSDGQRNEEYMSDGQRHYEDMSDHDKDMSDGQRNEQDMSDGQRNEEYMSDDYQRHDKDMSDGQRNEEYMSDGQKMSDGNEGNQNMLYQQKGGVYKEKLSEDNCIKLKRDIVTNGIDSIGSDINNLISILVDKVEDYVEYNKTRLELINKLAEIYTSCNAQKYISSLQKIRILSSRPFRDTKTFLISEIKNVIRTSIEVAIKIADKKIIADETNMRRIAKDLLRQQTGQLTSEDKFMVSHFMKIIAKMALYLTGCIGIDNSNKVASFSDPTLIEQINILLYIAGLPSRYSNKQLDDTLIKYYLETFVTTNTEPYTGRYIKNEGIKYIIDNATTTGGLSRYSFCPYSSIIDGMSQCSYGTATDRIEHGDMNFMITNLPTTPIASVQPIASEQPIASLPQHGSMYYNGFMNIDSTQKTQIDIGFNIRLPNGAVEGIKLNVDIRTSYDLQASIVLGDTLKSILDLNIPTTTTPWKYIEDNFLVEYQDPLRTEVAMLPLYAHILRKILFKGVGDLYQEVNAVAKNGGYTHTSNDTQGNYHIHDDVVKFDTNLNSIRLFAANDRPSGTRFAFMLENGFSNEINTLAFGGYISEAVDFVLKLKNPLGNRNYSPSTLSSNTGGRKYKNKTNKKKHSKKIKYSKHNKKNKKKSKKVKHSKK